MQPRTHDLPDVESQAIFAALVDDQLAEAQALRRAEQHQRDVAAAYLGAERIAESERLARRLGAR